MLSVDAEKVGALHYAGLEGTSKGLGNCRLWAACAEVAALATFS